MKSTHVLITGEDVYSIERSIGRSHPLSKRFREALAETDDPLLEKYRIAAMASTRDGEIEVDPGAVVSRGGDPGAYVMAWIWISDRKAGIDHESRE